MKTFRIRYRHKIAAASFILVMLPFTILYCLYAIKMYEENSTMLLNNLSNKFNTGVYEVENIFIRNKEILLRTCGYNRIVSFLESDKEKSMVEIYDFHTRIDEFLQSMLVNSTDAQLNIYTLGQPVGNGNFIKPLEMLHRRLPGCKGVENEVMDKPLDSFTWKHTYPQKLDMSSESGIESFTAFKKITSIHKNLAIIELSIPVQRIRSQFAGIELPEGAFIECFFGEDMEIIPLSEIHDGQEREVRQNISAEYALNKKHRGFIVYDSVLNSIPGRIVLFIPESYVLSGMKGFLMLCVLYFIGMAVAVCIIAEVISFFLTKRVSSLFEIANRDIEHLIASDTVQTYRFGDEFEKINGKFIELILKVKEYYKKIIGFESEKRELELELLQSRINPHMLYNTLETIKLVFRDRRLQQIIDSMTRYYRIALSNGNKIIQVGDELNMTEEYINIQKFIYEGSFDYSIEVDESLRHYHIIKHILQPIVENAIIHGVSGLESGGNVKISAAIDNGVLVFEISDNGVGMEEERIQRLIKGEQASITGGYGFRNVQRRIEAYYGCQYGVSIKSRLNEGTVVTIRVPAIKNSVADNKI